MAGIIAALANIAVLGTTPNLPDCGFEFFTVAAVFVVFAVILWFQLLRNVSQLQQNSIQPRNS